MLSEWRVEPGRETEIHDNLVQCYPETLYYTLAWKGPDEGGHTLASFETTLRFANSYNDIRLGSFFFLTLVT